MPTPRNTAQAAIRSTQPDTPNVGTRSGSASNGRATVVTSQLLMALTNRGDDFAYRGNHRVWSFQVNSMATVGHDDLTTATRALRKAALKVDPSSSHPRLD